MTLYRYGMRLRGVSPGAQPSDFFKTEEDHSRRYWEIIFYDRELTDKECRDYDLDFLGASDQEAAWLIKQYVSDNSPYLSPDLLEALKKGADALNG